MTEAEFHSLVASWLAGSFSDVEHEPRVGLPDEAPGEWLEPDFVAHTPFRSYAVEVEDSLDSLESGLGQAMRYAFALGEERGGSFEAVLVLPAGEHPGRSEYGPVEVVTV